MTDRAGLEMNIADRASCPTTSSESTSKSSFSNRAPISDNLRRPISWRFVVDPPADGAWTMAVDEALLEATERDGLATIRFYEWSEPTLSLGYFQAHAERRLHTASAACTLVRRTSGGGAILHD